MAEREMKRYIDRNAALCGTRVAVTYVLGYPITKTPADLTRTDSLCSAGVDERLSRLRLLIDPG